MRCSRRSSPVTITLDVTIEYIDDFNQPRTITKTLEIEVMEGLIEPTPDPSINGGGGGEWGWRVPLLMKRPLHKIFRFIIGLFGLDSCRPVWQSPGGGGVEAPLRRISVQSCLAKVDNGLHETI